MRFYHLLASMAFPGSFRLGDSPTNRCVEHRSLAGEFIDGPAEMSADPLVHFDAPMVTVFNSTISENWSFDATPTTAKPASSCMSPEAPSLAKSVRNAGLISVSWANGTRYMENAFVDMSTVTICPKSTSGLWTNHGGNITWGFTASTDFKYSVFTIKSPTINGTFKLKSRGPAIYPGGLVYPDANASVMLAPEMYWQEQFPVADASVDLNIRGTPFILSGVGGRDKNWNSRPWAVISGSWDMARTIVGPYGLMFWNYTSAVDGRSYFSATLMKGNHVIFRTSSKQPSHSGTYGSVKLTYGGPVHLSSAPGTTSPLPKSRHTGYLIDLLSPEAGEHWRFKLDFSQTTFWFPASETLNVGQFAGQVSGGLVGGKQFTGVASGSVQEYVL